MCLVMKRLTLRPSATSKVAGATTTIHSMTSSCATTASSSRAPTDLPPRGFAEIGWYGGLTYSLQVAIECLNGLSYSASSHSIHRNARRL